MNELEVLNNILDILNIFVTFYICVQFYNIARHFSKLFWEKKGRKIDVQ